MSKPDHDDEIEALTERFGDTQRELEEARLCEKLAREELEDLQRENIRLKGWQDCAREILRNSHPVTANHKA